MNPINSLRPLSSPPGLRPANAAAKPALTTLAGAVGNPAVSLVPLQPALSTPSVQGASKNELTPLSGGAGNSRREAVAAVKEFEAVFLRYLASAMTRSASGSSAGGAEAMKGGQFYQGLVDEQLGRLLAEAGGGLGLQDALLGAMNPEQGAADVDP